MRQLFSLALRLSLGMQAVGVLRGCGESEAS